MPKSCATVAVRVSVCALVLVLAGCGAPTVRNTVLSRPAHGGLTDDQVAMVAAAARQALSGGNGKGARLTSATAVLADGRIGASQSNTGQACTSGRILRVQLAGTFPTITTTGHPPTPSDPHPSTSVTAMLLSVDAVTGDLCLIGVTTSPVAPLPDSTALKVR